MYDIREDMMQKMIKELRSEQKHFEIISDEEFYNSGYGTRRRRKNEDCAREVYMHCLVPGNPKNLLAVYFKKKFICVAAPMEFDTFETTLDVERDQKKSFGKPYIKYKVSHKDYDDVYNDTKKLILELLQYARNNHLDQNW